MVKPATVPLLGMAAMRDMCTPSNDGLSIDSARDYSDALDVHYSSGVYNRAFCLLARTSGWNTRKAFEVFHDANALYWGPQETFDGGACGVEQAAADRGYVQADVAAAFNAVDVACPAH
jgi:pseudolysin/vibriolysin